MDDDGIHDGIRDGIRDGIHDGIHEEIYDNKCMAVKKLKGDTNEPNYKYNLRCKSIKQQNSMFCGVHNKHKPLEIVVILHTINNIKEWITIPFTNNKNIVIQIQNMKDEIVKNKLDKILKESEDLNSIIKCKVCNDDFPNCELIRCCKATSTNEHLVCNDCILGHIKYLISENAGSNTCMFNKSDKCGGEYKNSDITKAINNPEKQLQWDELVNVTEIYKMASICDDYVICPLCCKWGCIFEIPNGYRNNIYIPCAKCSESWCNFCKRKAHGTRSCYKLEFEENEQLEKKIEVINHMIQEIITKSLTHCCSTCGNTYIKEEGCNLMVCPKCESMTCYLCNMNLYYKNNTKYWHFIGHELSDPDASCKLWNNEAGDNKANQGNTEFNSNSIKKELFNFVNSNIIDGLSILIKVCIINIFKDDKEYSEIATYFTNI